LARHIRAETQSLFDGTRRSWVWRPDHQRHHVRECGWSDALVGEKRWRSSAEIGPELGLRSVRQIESFQRRYYADEEMNPTLWTSSADFSEHTNWQCAQFAAGLMHWLKDWQIDHFFLTGVLFGDEGAAKPEPVALSVTLSRLVLNLLSRFVDDA